MSSLYLLPSADPLIIEGGNTEETYTQEKDTAKYITEREKGKDWGRGREGGREKRGEERKTEGRRRGVGSYKCHITCYHRLKLGPECLNPKCLMPECLTSLCTYPQCLNVLIVSNFHKQRRAVHKNNVQLELGDWEQPLNSLVGCSTL